jgi:hypothetical protein
VGVGLLPTAVGADTAWYRCPFQLLPISIFHRSLHDRNMRSNRHPFDRRDSSPVNEAASRTINKS